MLTLSRNRFQQGGNNFPGQRKLVLRAIGIMAKSEAAQCVWGADGYLGSLSHP